MSTGAGSIYSNVPQPTRIVFFETPYKSLGYDTPGDAFEAIKVNRDVDMYLIDTARAYIIKLKKGVSPEDTKTDNLYELLAAGEDI